MLVFMQKAVEHECSAISWVDYMKRLNLSMSAHSLVPKTKSIRLHPSGSVAMLLKKMNINLKSK